MNQEIRQICSAIAKGVAASLRKRYPQLRIEGHPANHVQKSTGDDDSSIAGPALLIIKDSTNQHGLHIQIASKRTREAIINITLRVITDGNISKPRPWLTIDLIHPNSLDYLERQIARQLHDLSGLWPNRLPGSPENSDQLRSICH